MAGLLEKLFLTDKTLGLMEAQRQQAAIAEIAGGLLDQPQEMTGQNAVDFVPPTSRPEGLMGAGGPQFGQDLERALLTDPRTANVGIEMQQAMARQQMVNQAAMARQMQGQGYAAQHMTAAQAAEEETRRADDFRADQTFIQQQVEPMEKMIRLGVQAESLLAARNYDMNNFAHADDMELITLQSQLARPGEAMMEGDVLNIQKSQQVLGGTMALWDQFFKGGTLEPGMRANLVEHIRRRTGEWSRDYQNERSILSEGHQRLRDVGSLQRYLGSEVQYNPGAPVQYRQESAGNTEPPAPGGVWQEVAQ